MREEITKIIVSLISNIGGVRVINGDVSLDNRESMNVLGRNTAAGIEELKVRWPELNTEEKYEIDAVVRTLHKIHD